MRCQRIFSIILCGAVLCAKAVFAQDIRFTAEVDQTKIALGSSAQLTLTVEGAQDIQPPAISPVDGLDIRYLGPATRVSIVNGQYSTSKSFMYSILPLKVGRFTIPSLTIDITGKTYPSEPVIIEVVDAPGAVAGQIPQGQSAGEGAQEEEATVSLQDRVFLALKVPKDKVYLNEPLPVKILLFISSVQVADVRFPELSQAGIDVAKIPQPQQYDQVINGVRYHIAEFDTTVYPTRVGELTLGPAKLECNLVVRTSSAPGRSPLGGGVFNDDFFNSFFDRYEKRPLTLQSKTTTLTVLPLPEEGKPAGFTGAVGQFHFEATASPSEVNVGDPITIKMNLAGKGNIKAATPPAYIRVEQFKVYDPQIKEEDGSKKLEQVLIPESDQLTQIPGVQFSYFDPSLGRYQTISKGPFPITVHKSPAGGQTLKVVAGESLPGQALRPEVLGQDIVFIKGSPGDFYPIGQRFYTSPLFFVVILILFGLWLFLFVMYQRTHKIETDIVYARRLRAPREARRGLNEARHLLGVKNTQKFYDIVFKTWQGYLGNKLHLSPGEVTRETVQAKLAGRLDERRLAEIRKVFEESDAVRYAPSEINTEMMRESYSRLERLIDELERLIK
ncbi:MAG: protein BatD [Candidatus Omnitrophica bacterium]|nr:protein BatD [Candidatus Omnitrophota bacterium]